MLFADIVRFTRLAEVVAPNELVTMLNRVFTAFDEIADRYGVEKIKTLGDAYMLAAGVPQPRADHVDAVADAALAMRDALVRFDDERLREVTMRIGIYTGPVVAGVIGKRKLVYDLWRGRAD